MKYFLVSVMLLVAATAAAQEETLLGGTIEQGGFGAPVVKFTTTKKQFALYAGAYGGWLINHAFLIGAGGYGLVSTIRPATEAAGLLPAGFYSKLEVGYGGLVLEYIGKPMDLVHYSVSVLIGAGGALYSERSWLNTNWNESALSPTATFFVFEPGVNAELNLTSFLRIALGGSYRFVNGVDLSGVSNSDIGGPSMNLALKFGSF